MSKLFNQKKSTNLKALTSSLFPPGALINKKNDYEFRAFLNYLEIAIFEMSICNLFYVFMWMWFKSKNPSPPPPLFFFILRLKTWRGISLEYKLNWKPKSITLRTIFTFCLLVKTNISRLFSNHFNLQKG